MSTGTSIPALALSLVLGVAPLFVPAGPVAQEDVSVAVAVLQPTQGNDVRGVVHFRDVSGGVLVVAEITGLEPGSSHGFHVHEFGDATAPDGSSAGSHFDPGKTKHHARPNAPEPHHAGDMGNVEADASGRARYEAVIEDISIAGSNNPILGRAVIVHAKADTFVQPTGDAGDRVAIGIIGVANPERANRSIPPRGANDRDRTQPDRTPASPR